MSATSEKESSSGTACWSSCPDISNASTSAVWCLIDHPEIWTRFDRTAEFQNSTRLMSLVKKPKNEIVQLPDPVALARQFCCVMCSEIPFAWTGDPEYMSSEDENPEGAFLCGKGHTVCRSCRQCCYTCTATPADLSYISKNNNNNNPALLEMLEPASGSIGRWGQAKFCFSSITYFRCFFLMDMINEGEFACKYFYNWCHFRGRGNDLREHESKCPFGFPLLEADSKNTCEHNRNVGVELQSKDNNSDDESRILGFKLDAAISETNEFLRMHIPDWDLLNPRNQTKFLRKKKG